MWLCYALVQNVGWAIIIFTLITKTALFPLSLKQQKNMAISQLYTPRVQEIQRKYKNNPEKQQEELTKLQKEGYNPTGGCGTMIIQWLVLFGIIGVVYKPMTHMEHFKKAEISAIVQTAEEIDIAQAILASPEDAAAILAYRDDPASITLVENKKEKTSNKIVLDKEFDYNAAKSETTVTAEDLAVYGSFTADEIKTITGKDSRLSVDVRNAVNLIANNHYSDNSLYGELRALKTFETSSNRAIFAQDENISEELLDRLDNLLENMYFGPVSLIDTPTMSWSPQLIIPVITLLFAMAQTIIQQRIQKKQNPQMAEMQGNSRIMFYIMPLISVWISFSVPAGAGFYWALTYLFGIIQVVLTAKFWPADKIRAEAKEKMAAMMAEREQKAKVVVVDAEGNETEKVQRLSELTQKEIRELNRKKLEAARRADAEKYGEEYIESDDDDF